MAGNRSLLALALLGWVSLSTAENHRGSKTDNRELQVTRDFMGKGEESCTEKLAQCRLVMGGAGSLPYDEWGKMLTTFEKSEDSSAPAISATTSLRELMMTLEAIDFNAVGDSLEAMASAGTEANAAALRDVADELMSSSTTARAELNIFELLPIENFTLTLVQQLIRLWGILFMVDVSPVLALATTFVSFVTLFFQLTVAIAGGPFVFVGVLKSNIATIVDLIASVVGIAITPPNIGGLIPGLSPPATSTNTTATSTSITNTTRTSAELVDVGSFNKQCAQELVQCHFDQLVIHTLPSMVAGAFLIDSLGNQGADP